MFFCFVFSPARKKKRCDTTRHHVIKVLEKTALLVPGFSTCAAFSTQCQYTADFFNNRRKVPVGYQIALLLEIPIPTL